jgi:hypothetical protein
MIITPYDIALASSRPVPLRVSGLQQWLDGDDRTTAVLDSSGNGSEWLDKSGFGRHALQATSGNRPPYTTGVVNGRSAFVFNGSTNRMTTNAYALPQPVTVFAVAQSSNNTGYRVIADSISPRISMYTQNGTNFEVSAGTLGSGAVSVGTASPRLYSAVFNGGSSKTRFGKTDIFTGNVGANSMGGGLCIGAGPGGTNNWWAGPICEILVYGKILNASEYEAIESYLIGKWGVPI